METYHLYSLQLAGGILLCIALANCFAPQKMRWPANLQKVEPLFRQVFIIHCIFLIACVVAMALACLFYPGPLMESVLGKAVLGFMAVFWLARLLIQWCYYEKSIKRRYPVYNAIFTVAFAYLAGVFWWLAM